METNKILSADVLDILFEGRNKEYGAYTLRKGYNGRLGRSLLIMGGVVVVLFMMSFVGGRGKVKKDLVIVDTVQLTPLSKKVVPPPPPPPPPPKPQPPVATRIFTAPALVKDPPEDEKPPVVDDLEKVRIGTVNTPGGADVGDVAPPAPLGDGGNVVEKPKEVEGNDRFMPIEKEADYPGGVQAWVRFLKQNLRAPDAALDAVGQTRVEVQFVVDKDGNVSDVKAISGPEDNGMREEAVRVIKKSGKWVPALQNGRNVRTVKVQPVIFLIQGN
jgi:periplasmic protein TonB